MKSAVGSLLLLLLIPAIGLAQCRYFRVAAQLLQCGMAKASAIHEGNPYLPESEEPMLQEHSNQILVQAQCSCDYSLSGSDPTCDVDQTIEKSVTLEAPAMADVCRRGRSLCRDICPSTL